MSKLVRVNGKVVSNWSIGAKGENGDENVFLDTGNGITASPIYAETSGSINFNSKELFKIKHHGVIQVYVNYYLEGLGGLIGVNIKDENGNAIITTEETSVTGNNVTSSLLAEVGCPVKPGYTVNIWGGGLGFGSYKAFYRLHNSSYAFVDGNNQQIDLTNKTSVKRMLGKVVNNLDIQQYDNINEKWEQYGTNELNGFQSAVQTNMIGRYELLEINATRDIITVLNDGYLESYFMSIGSFEFTTFVSIIVRNEKGEKVKDFKLNFQAYQLRPEFYSGGIFGGCEVKKGWTVEIGGKGANIFEFGAGVLFIYPTYKNLGDA